MVELALEEDTIVAVSTPPGRGGIGVVRVSGAGALAVVGLLLQLKRPLAAGRARFGFVIDAVTHEVLDEVVATYFAGPRSYTGEDVVELAVHGSPALLEYVVRACCAAGARLAEAGEFTQRAFLRGRIDLTQAEAVDDLIQSQTMEQARVAARQLGGALARVVGPVKAQLVGLIAGLEAGIDFAEDDIDVMPVASITAGVAEVVTPLRELEQSFAYGRVVREGFSLAIVGRPNAGKSSLFNRLVERERAIVTATPGTTRDTVSERVSLEGIPVELVDTAGLRDASETDEVERIGMARSREAMADADVVLVVVDASVGMSAEDEALVAGLQGRAFVVVWNKCDLVVVGEEQLRGQEQEQKQKQKQKQKQEQNQKRNTGVLRFAQDDGVKQATATANATTTTNANASADADARSRSSTSRRMTLLEGRGVRVSALTGEGVAELRRVVVEMVSGGGAASSSAMLTNVRQQQAVSSAIAAVERAGAAASQGIPHEMVLLDLYEGLGALDSLTGATTSDDVLRLIFSRFCIGK